MKVNGSDKFRPGIETENSNPSVTHNSPINQELAIKYLSVARDRKLTFKEHADRIRAKLEEPQYL